MDWHGKKVALMRHTEHSLTAFASEDLGHEGFNVVVVDGRETNKWPDDIDAAVLMGLGQPKAKAIPGDRTREEGLVVLDQLVARYGAERVVVHSNHGLRNGEMDPVLERKGVTFVHALSHTTPLVNKLKELTSHKAIALT